MKRSNWRLIVDGEADGATNMAVDEAILVATIEGARLPTLRFYGWRPACLTLGRSQPLADAELTACRSAGVDVVRRPTGGQAILHIDELTYSVALLQSDPRATGDIIESYRHLSEGLLAGLHHLGVEAVQAHRQPKSETKPTPICFDTPSDYEIAFEGRKLVGSAQWRSRGGVLQHGTLPLCGDLTRIIPYLVFAEAEREFQKNYLRQRAATLEEALGYAASFEQAAHALATGFAEALNLELIPGELTGHERALVSELRRSRYGAAEWTARV
jgi:lipoate-protein ligase A